MGPDNGSLFANRHPLPAKSLYLPLAWFAENIAVIHIYMHVHVVTALSALSVMVIGLGFVRVGGTKCFKIRGSRSM